MVKEEGKRFERNVRAVKVFDKAKRDVIHPDSRKQNVGLSKGIPYGRAGVITTFRQVERSQRDEVVRQVAVIVSGYVILVNVNQVDAPEG